MRNYEQQFSPYFHQITVTHFGQVTSTFHSYKTRQPFPVWGENFSLILLPACGRQLLRHFLSSFCSSDLISFENGQLCYQSLLTHISSPFSGSKVFFLLYPVTPGRKVKNSSTILSLETGHISSIKSFMT
jgi:hypothetical protein